MDNDQADNVEEQELGPGSYASECLQKVWLHDHWMIHVVYDWIVRLSKTWPQARSWLHRVVLAMAAGVLSPASVKEIKDILQKERARLPAKFDQLEALYAMTQNPPMLSQLARNKIRAQMKECGKLSDENIKKLELPRACIDSVLLEGIGQEVMEKIMEGADELDRRIP